MIAVRKNEENVLQDGNEELSEEETRCLLICLCHVVQQLNAHVEPSVLDFAIIVLARPHAGVDDKLELSAVEFEQCCIPTSIQSRSII